MTVTRKWRAIKRRNDDMALKVIDARQHVVWLYINISSKKKNAAQAIRGSAAWRQRHMAAASDRS